MALGVPYQGPAHRHRDVAAGVSSPRDFSLPRAVEQEGGLRGLVFGRLLAQQLGSSTANRLVCRPAVGLFRALVPIRDVSVQISDVDRIMGTVQQSGLFPKARLALSQRLERVHQQHRRPVARIDHGIDLSREQRVDRRHGFGELLREVTCVTFLIGVHRLNRALRTGIGPAMEPRLVGCMPSAMSEMGNWSAL